MEVAKIRRTTRMKTIPVLSKLRIIPYIDPELSARFNYQEVKALDIRARGVRLR